jgi:predicted HTH transcriptional regulator
MQSLQELITRGRFAFSDAPARLDTFTHVNGKRNTKEIASKVKRHVNNVRRDLTTLSDVGLIEPKLSTKGTPMTKDGFPIFDKVPLARTIPVRYFTGAGAIAPASKSDLRVLPRAASKSRSAGRQTLAVPSEPEILEIAKNGEDQVYEFKRAGVEVPKITREIAAMLNTERGGLIFYGIDDDGTISGTDMSRQKLDQAVQNSLRNTVSPSATVALRSVKVLGTEILVLVVPPWNRKDVYQLDGRVHIRKGTNVFIAGPEEVKSLHRGDPVV